MHELKLMDVQKKYKDKEHGSKYGSKRHACKYLRESDEHQSGACIQGRFISA